MWAGTPCPWHRAPTRTHGPVSPGRSYWRRLIRWSCLRAACRETRPLIYVWYVYVWRSRGGVLRASRIDGAGHRGRPCPEIYGYYPAVDGYASALSGWLGQAGIGFLLCWALLGLGLLFSLTALRKSPLLASVVRARFQFVVLTEVAVEVSDFLRVGSHSESLYHAFSPTSICRGALVSPSQKPTRLIGYGPPAETPSSRSALVSVRAAASWLGVVVTATPRIILPVGFAVPIEDCQPAAASTASISWANRTTSASRFVQKMAAFSIEPNAMSFAEIAACRSRDMCRGLSFSSIFIRSRRSCSAFSFASAARSFASAARCCALAISNWCELDSALSRAISATRASFAERWASWSFRLFHQILIPKNDSPATPRTTITPKISAQNSSPPIRCSSAVALSIDLPFDESSFFVLFALVIVIGGARQLNNSSPSADCETRTSKGAEAP